MPLKLPSRKVAVIGIVLIAVICVALYFLCKTYPVDRSPGSFPSGKNVAPKTAVGPSSQQAQPINRQSISSLGAAVHPITKAAVDAGFLAPAVRLNQVANFLTAGTQSGSLLFLRPGQTDRDMLSSSFEAVRGDNSSLYASASFASGPVGYEAVYDTVEYGSAPCSDIEKQVFSNLKKLGVLKKNITVLNSGTVKVFLMPAGKGCVVIKKEIVQ